MTRAEVPASSVPLKPRWIDSDMRSSYANVCNVMGNREEISLLFGTKKGWKSDSKEMEIELSQRIVLSPFTAKRLAQMLAQGIKEYEHRFGPIELDDLVGSTGQTLEVSKE